MRPDLTPSPVNLLLVCKELRALRADPNLGIIDKVTATEAFKDALWKKLGFPPAVTKWDDEAIEMYLEIIISVG
jgi:hypothetical protein